MKVIIFSAPSGAGKTTILKEILKEITNIEFSISATSRKPRGEEKDGVDYYFFTKEEFRKKINQEDFLEWEEVYQGDYYGTLKSEFNRIFEKGNIVISDIDVKGGLNIKKTLGDNALALFIMPPDIATLKERLIKRSTDDTKSIEKRIEKAQLEITYASKFDKVVINNNLDEAIADTLKLIRTFIKS